MNIYVNFLYIIMNCSQNAYILIYEKNYNLNIYVFMRI